MKKFLLRFWGHAYGAYSAFLRDPDRYGGEFGSHIESKWTPSDHFAHSNYNRGHLPQLCIVASGWKARLLALFFWPPTPYVPDNKYIVWWKNGDHPFDDVYRPYEDTGKIPTEPREGKYVRYYRLPGSGNSYCDDCNMRMNDHGFIDTCDGGVTVCPGDYVLVNKEDKI